MGGGPSRTRKITVENDDPTSVIKVSDDVVERIKGVAQTVKKESHGSTPVSNESIAPVFMNEPSLTSLQLRQAHVKELKENDDYWANRVKALEENHKKMNQVMDEEYKRALDEFKGVQRVQKLKEPPCLDCKRAVMECYKCYPQEPLRCAKLVQAYQECVDIKRANILASKG